MARPKLQSGGTQLSAGQAAYVLERLVQDRRISQGEVNRYAAEMTREISSLEARLQQLRSEGGRVPPASKPTGGRRGRRSSGNGGASATAARAAQQGAPSSKQRRRGAKITAEQLESRKLQGRYLSLVRQIPASKRAHYKKIVKERGRAAAIKEMQAAIGK